MLKQTKKRHFKSKLTFLLVIVIMIQMILPSFGSSTYAAENNGEIQTETGSIASTVSGPAIEFDESGDISSKVVTKLSVNPYEIYDGQSTKVHLEFEGNKYGKPKNIQGGNTISVAWPTSGDAFFEGYTKQLELIDNGKYIADAVITKTGATITFKNIVNKLDDVAGYLDFEIMGRNVTNTTQEDIKTGSITSGNEKVDVSIKKGSSGTSSVFYYKTGRIDTGDTEHVKWWLNANVNRSYVDEDIIIEDEIQDGQKLDMKSFGITVRGYKEGGFYGDDAIQKFQQSFPGCTITANDETNKIEVRICKEYASLNTFSIYYQTKITEPTQKAFVNNSRVWYKENGKSKVDGESFNHTVSNISSGGGITGTVRGELKIVKVIEGKNVGIPNVIFELTRKDGAVILEGKNTLELKTDEEGIANVKGLPIGVYQVKEKSAPEWIDFDPTKAESITFEVKESDAEGTLLDISNKKKVVDVPVNKVWDGAPDTKPTIQLQLYKNDQEEESFVELKNGETSYTWRDLDKTDDNGIDYSYTVKEIGESNGRIQLNGEEYEVSYEGSAKDGYTITNKKVNIEEDIKGNIIFNKIDENNHPLPGAEFTLYRDDDTEFKNPMSTAISNDEGKVEFKDIPYGSYKIIETKAPNGFVLSKEVLTAAILKNLDVVTATPASISNTKIKGHLEINKVDKTTLKPLANAQISVYNESDTLIAEKTTDENGIATFENIPYGNYYYIESQAPSGYIRDLEKHLFTISEDGKIIQVTFENERIPDTTDPGNNENPNPGGPGDNNPGNNNSGGNNPGDNNPGDNNPGDNNPEDNNKPEDDKLEEEIEIDPNDVPLGSKEANNGREVNNGKEVNSGKISINGNENGKLPKTGESINAGFYITGIVMIFIGFALKRRIKHHE